MERLGAHVDKARIKGTLDAMIRRQQLAASRPRQRPEALERLKFWLGMPNQYYDSEWRSGGMGSSESDEQGSAPAKSVSRTVDSSAWVAGGGGGSEAEQGCRRALGLSSAQGSGEWSSGGVGSSGMVEEGSSPTAARNMEQASAEGLG